MTIAERTHLYPSRTQKLSSLALMILGGTLPGKVGRCRLIWPHGQAVKTPPFHGGNRGSIPRGVTKYAGLAELADALDLGSSGKPCRFNSCHPHQKKVSTLSMLFLVKSVLRWNKSTAWMKSACADEIAFSGYKDGFNFI